VGWVKKFYGGIILVLILLSLATSFAAYLSATHQSCSATAASATAASATSQLGSTTSSSSYSDAPPAAGTPYLPLSAPASELVLTPLANLTVAEGNASAPSDLTDPAFWGEVHTSEFRTYEEIIPQTVIGFFNSSEEWRAWALQNLPDSSGWLATGFVTEAQNQVVAVDPSGRVNETSTAVEQGVDDFAATADGLTLASLDYLTFNGLSGLKTLFETNDPTLAACQTLPGQLAQLYDSSFDASVSQSERADYLGRALAITSVMLLLGGKDAFADHFRAAIDGAGLGDAWPAVKPYLGDIASKVSAGASSATFAVLQTLAQRFPQDSAWVTGLTADRVGSMVDVLHGKGVSDGTIQDDIAQVAKTADGTSDEQTPGETADGLSLHQGGEVLLKVKAGNKIVRYDDGNGRTANIRGTFLQQVIPGFDPRGPNFVAIHYKEAGVTVYHYYDQKVAPGKPYEPKDTEWNPRAPDIVGKKGDVVTVTFELLTPDKFLKSVPPFEYLNSGRAAWVSGFSEVKSLQLIGDKVRMSVLQEPMDGVSSFTIDGTFDSLQNSNGDTSALFSIPNVVDKPRMMKITFNGYGKPVLGISSGSNYNPVTSISSDGIRLRIVSNSGGPAVTTSTLYLRDPSPGWDVGTMTEQDLGFHVQGASQTFKIDQVSAVDAIDDGLVHSKSTIDLGRAGAEIAYTVAEKRFHLNDVRLYEITQGGKDLDTRDGMVVIQARMLANPTDLTGSQLSITLDTQMNDLAEKLQEDFQNNPAKTGFAILSYLDPSSNVVHTLVAEVDRNA
jgi:hypothetical protein